MIPKKSKKPKNEPQKTNLTNKQKRQIIKACENNTLLCEQIDLKNTTKEQLLYSLKHIESLLQKQQRIIDNLLEATKFQRKIIKDHKKGISTIINKYEDGYQEYEKANKELKKENTQLTLNVEDLKERLFGKLTMRLKNFAMRPDKKKDN